MRGTPLYPYACWRRWASRRKWPNPQLLLQHQSPPITLLPSPYPPTQHIPTHHSTPPPAHLTGWHPCHARESRHNTRNTDPRGRAGGHMMRSPQGAVSVGKDRLKVVMCPCQGSDPTIGHPGPQKLPLGKVWGVHFDVHGQWQGADPTLSLRCVDPTQSSETGTVRGIRWHNLKGKEG